MFDSREFLLLARLDAAALAVWTEAGWLAPRQAGPEHTFSELDLPRVCLIRDLREGQRGRAALAPAAHRLING